MILWAKIRLRKIGRTHNCLKWSGYVLDNKGGFYDDDWMHVVYLRTYFVVALRNFVYIGKKEIINLSYSLKLLIHCISCLHLMLKDTDFNWNLVLFQCLLLQNFNTMEILYFKKYNDWRLLLSYSGLYCMWLSVLKGFKINISFLWLNLLKCALWMID